MKCVICDVDGTLLDVNHRLHYLDDSTLDRNQQWNAFFAAQHLDTPIEPICWLLNKLWQTAGEPNSQYKILIVSARPDNYRDVTETSLSQCVFYDRLYMRKANDTRADHIVKAEILEQILNDGYEPFLVIDDRQSVVDMWRSFGITTLQCAADDSRSKYAGQALLTVVVGPSGAGKSTFVEKNYVQHSIISTDQLRADNGWGHHPDDLRRTWELAHNLTGARLRSGVSTILDATNIKQKDRLKVLELVPKGQLVNYVVIDRDLGAKLKDRGWRPEELVLKHHRTFQSQLKNILDGDNQPNVIVHDKRIKL